MAMTRRPGFGRFRAFGVADVVMVLLRRIWKVQGLGLQGRLGHENVPEEQYRPVVVCLTQTLGADPEPTFCAS